ncbi:MAG TPA: hypothetical protein PLJ35_18585 [Anaerolineae bacterium]|nr:hypothetical protein [Anaerolineae bacterium]HOR00825.1 hypothetical protein [Anaerolineae bacterium]HPL28031.1 hypothetical protein [Anaerolineae bacterium]
MSMSDYPWRSATPNPASEGEPSGQRLREAAAQAGQRLEETAGETARQAEKRTRRIGANLYRGAERARILAAEGLARAAGGLRGSSTGSDTTAHRFADSLDRSADYLRRTELSGMQRDAAGLVQQYPLQALGLAFVVGLLVGQRLSRD